MSFKLNKKQLESSVYYCGAGIDFQPILRFGDIVENYVYVTAGLIKDEFINGIDDFIKVANEELIKNNSYLAKISVSTISIDEIEHPISSREIHGKPDFFSDDDFNNYLQSLRPFIEANDNFHLEVCFILKIGSVEKVIRLFHLSGEALATYDMLYRRQNIAPKVFISIQTGLIEIPSLFSNRLFELSSVRPKIWLRGAWSNSDDSRYNTSPKVFDKIGVFNERVGDYRNWRVLTSDSINSSIYSEKKYRVVKAYGEKSIWKKSSKIDSYSKNGIVINKFLKRYDHASMSCNYDIIKEDFPLTRISEISTEAIPFYHGNKKSTENRVRVCIVPGGFECFEASLQPFFDAFLQHLDLELQIDIYYNNKSDFNRIF